MNNVVREEFEKYMVEYFGYLPMREEGGYQGVVEDRMWLAWQKSHRLTKQGYQ